MVWATCDVNLSFVAQWLRMILMNCLTLPNSLFTWTVIEPLLLMIWQAQKSTWISSCYHASKLDSKVVKILQKFNCLVMIILAANKKDVKLETESTRQSDVNCHLVTVASLSTASSLPNTMTIISTSMTLRIARILKVSLVVLCHPASFGVLWLKSWALVLKKWKHFLLIHC